MYPQAELIRLAAYKAALRRAIADQRAQVSNSLERIAQPLRWIDRAYAVLRQTAPLARTLAVPAAIMVLRAVAPKSGLFQSALRWAPALFGASKLFAR